ncbi:MAG: hypothetical protein L0206_24285, partial [Actinobacteria bacterium]|nr:hypothetical protein [Actinomycetota bacterium]
AAHRGYRAAALLRNLFAPTLEDIDRALAAVRPIDAIRRVIERLPRLVQLNAFARIAAAGRWLKENVTPLAGAVSRFQASLEVSVGPEGPHAMAAEVALADDAKLVPFPYDHSSGLFWWDFFTSAHSLAGGLAEAILTRSPRPADIVSAVFTLLYDLLRTIFRAVRLDAIQTGFLRFFFSDWNAFLWQLFWRFIGSIEDMCAWSNWTQNFGQRLARYWFWIFQPRIVYLFARAVWHAKQKWPKDHKMPVERYVWLPWFFTACAALIVGIVYGVAVWEDFSIRNVGTGVAGAIVGLVFSVVFDFVVRCIFPSITFEKIEVSTAQFFMAMSVGAFVTFVAFGGLGQTKGQREGAGEWALPLFMPMIFGIVMLIGIAEGTRPYLYTGFITWLCGTLMVGVGTTYTWWFAICDGWDCEGAYDDLEKASSPYLLPYASDDWPSCAWMCGQGFHGFYSHLYADLDDHYGYDLNNAPKQPALAMRTGIVVEVVDLNPDDENTRNDIRLLHTSWAIGHDPGIDAPGVQEHVLFFSNYIHLARNRAYVLPDQLVRRGFHLLDINSTGNSSQNHLHVDVSSQADASSPSLPFIFSDGNADAPEDGRPCSMTFYDSDNVRSDTPSPFAMRLTTQPAADGHTHAWTIDYADLPGDLATSVTFRTDPGYAGGPPPTSSQGHEHTIALTGSQIVELLSKRDLPGVVTSPGPDGHTHALTVANTRLSQTQPGLTLSIVPPPAAQLLARRTGPYDLLGEQMVLRVNGRTTETYFFGAHRPSMAGRITLDRGPGRFASIEVTVLG